MLNGYITAKEAAEKWGVCTRRVQYMCSIGIIPGVTKFGNVWVLPETVEKPADGRIKSGKYKNWRKKGGKKL